MLVRKNHTPVNDVFGFPLVLDRLLNDRFWNDEFLAPVAKAAFAPAVDIVDAEQAVTLRLDVPGVNKEDIKVAVDGGVLTISGERRNEVNEEKAGWTRYERTFGKFSRSFRLPETVDAEAVKAVYKDGVLTLEVPKRAPATVKTIDVQVA